MSLLRSWVPGANDPAGDFPLNNLPYGVFTRRGQPGPRLCTAIGGFLLDLHALAEAGLLGLPHADGALRAPVWNGFMALGPAAWDGLRTRLMALLAEGAAERSGVATCLVPRADVSLHLPLQVAEFTDFYAGRYHALNAARILRGADATLPPAWDHMPIGYNGRSSSVVVSGTPVARPRGQIRPDPGGPPLFAPTRRLDFELEIGTVIGQPSHGPVPPARAEAMIFGHVLLNDWSARDVQAWEYQPLGPFQSKAAATSISPWIIPSAALAPFRVAGPDPAVPLLPYLRTPHPMHLDIALEVTLTPEGGPESVIARTNARELAWSAPQQIAQHTTSGCPMRVGDLIGSGTISGPTRDSRGALLELAWGGTDPIRLPCGRARSYLEDGDTVTFRGHAQGEGFRIGFGACTGTILPPAPLPEDWPV